MPGNWQLPGGVSQERGELYYVPGTGEKLVHLRTIASPVPGTFTPKLGTHPLPGMWYDRILRMADESIHISDVRGDP